MAAAVIARSSLAQVPTEHYMRSARRDAEKHADALGELTISLRGAGIAVREHGVPQQSQLPREQPPPGRSGSARKAKAKRRRQPQSEAARNGG